MGIIENKVRDAFYAFRNDHDIHKFAVRMAQIGDYSVRSMTHWYVLVESINKIKEEDELRTINEITFNEDDLYFE